MKFPTIAYMDFDVNVRSVLYISQLIHTYDITANSVVQFLPQPRFLIGSERLVVIGLPSSS